jgi:hypothetical protein
MRRSILLSLILTTTAWSQPPMLEGWDHRKLITVQSDLVDATLSNFPLLVVITSDVDMHDAQNDGGDLRFTANDGTTLLPYYIKTWSGGGGGGSAVTAICYVQIPTIDADTGATFYIYWSNAGASDASDSGTTWPAAYVGVWHMTTNGGNETDYSGNAKTLTQTGGTIPTTTGKLGNARDFEAGDTENLQKSDEGGSLDLSGSNQKVSITAWVRLESNGSSTKHVAGKYVESGYGRQYMLGISNTGAVIGRLSSTGSSISATGVGATTLIADSATWYHIAMVYDDTDIRVYVNGSLDENGTSNPKSYTSGIYNGAARFSIGSDDMDSGGQYLDGLIDEVRVLNTDLSAAWVKFEYSNVNSADNELTWGTVEPNTPPDYYSLTTDATNGSITLDPAGGVYEPNTVVTLTAVPDTGYTFDYWTGDLSDSNNPETLTMTGNKSVTAVFDANEYTLSITAVNGSVDLNPAGGTYDYGTVVTLTATPNESYMFTEWTGDLTGEDNPDTITITANKSVTANFASGYTLSTSASNGSVILVPAGGSYASGTVVTLAALPAPGYMFSYWSGTGIDPNMANRRGQTIEMTANRSVTAHFVAWETPIGIPEPNFGITETYRMYDVPGNRNPALNYQASAEGGFFTHYIDQDHPSATDTANPYGSIAVPRRTVPYYATKIPAGSVVEIHGSTTYSRTYEFWNCRGTAAMPVFIRGSSTVTPDFRSQILLMGSWGIIEGLKVGVQILAVTPYDLGYAEPNYMVIRACEIYPTGWDVAAGIGFESYHESNTTRPVRYNMAYANYIHDKGDFEAVEKGLDDDQTGLVVGDEAHHIWLLDNVITHCSGGGIMINAGNSVGRSEMERTHHVYVGRNTVWNVYQSGIQLKRAVDVIYSQNASFTNKPRGAGAPGGGLEFQYGPDRIWYIFNELWDNEYGVQSNSASGMAGGSIYIIGNVIYDNVVRYASGTGVWAKNVGIHLTDDSSATHYIQSNTIYDCGGGIYTVRGSGYQYIENNIIKNVTGKHLWIESPNQSSRSDAANNLFGQTAVIRWGDSTDRNVTQMKAVYGECMTSLESDPLFVDPDANDFHLQPGSPGIDAGLYSSSVITARDAFEIAYSLSIRRDFDDVNRPQGDYPDMGAFEYYDAPPEPNGAPSQITTATIMQYSTGIAATINILWAAATDANYYKVYFADHTPLTDGDLQRTTSNLHAIIYGSSYSTTYYWRVDSYNNTTHTHGVENNLTTMIRPLRPWRAVRTGGKLLIKP